jgi:uncharacterized protein Usg
MESRKDNSREAVVIIIPKKVLVTLDVYYYMPKHSHLINEFLWQTDDVYPKFDRVNTFMTFWRENVRAVISEVVMAYCDRGRWTKVDVETVIK